MPISVAIVGSGPAGFYAADALLKTDRGYEIDILERLPAPFGLIGYGVAPDHQTTKKIARTFGQTAAREQVRYFGNVEVGRDIGVPELRDLYDAVILAVGAPRDRPLSIPGIDQRGVIGAAAFVGWYNGHPDFQALDPDLDVATVAVIGNGNVAIDVARVLVKTPAEMAAADLPDYAARTIHGSPLRDVHMFGRRGPIQASFTNVELREMGKLEACGPIVDPAQIPDAIADDMSDRDRRLKERNLATLRDFAAREPAGKAKHVHFQFFAAPREVLGDGRVSGLTLERTRLKDGRAVGTGEFFDVRCGLVLYAIGNVASPLDGVPFDAERAIIANADGRVAEGLYAVGWAMRDPVGVIATNRRDAVTVAKHIAADVGAGATGAGATRGRQALEHVLAACGVRRIGFAEWCKIEAAEVANAAPGAPRRKFLNLHDMLEVL